MERDWGEIGTRLERDWRDLSTLRASLMASRMTPRIASHNCALHHQVDLDLPALTAAASGETPPAETVAAKAAAATQLLNAHRAKIAEELAARRKLILLLAGSIESQHEQCAALKTALASCESMLATAARAAAM